MQVTVVSYGVKIYKYSKNLKLKHLLLFYCFLNFYTIFLDTVQNLNKIA